jgi:hypothetical protein
MPVQQARACLDRLKDHWQAFWFELRAFHEGKGWLALGYSSFKACVEQELGMSERHAYRLLEAAGVYERLTDHAVSTENLTEYHARQLVPLPPTEQRAVWADAVATDPDGKPSVRDLRRLVKERATEERTERLARPVPVPEPPAELAYSPEPTNLWHFHQCDPRFGAEHPGRIPGQIMVNLLHLYTERGDLVLDLFAGSGTTIDVCRAMGRECVAFDLALRRPDIRPMDALDVRLDDLPQKSEAGLPGPPVLAAEAGRIHGRAAGSLEPRARRVLQHDGAAGPPAGGARPGRREGGAHHQPGAGGRSSSRPGLRVRQEIRARGLSPCRAHLRALRERSQPDGLLDGAGPRRRVPAARVPRPDGL